MASFFELSKTILGKTMAVWRRELLTAGLAVTANAFALTAEPTSAATAEASVCDRGCLNGMMDKYLPALVRHDPSGLPVAANLKASENARLIKLGATGAWTQIKRVYPGYQNADSSSGQVVFGGAVDSADGIAALFVRLKVRNRQIVESEIIFNQGKSSGPSPFDPSELIEPDLIYDAIVPPPRRSTRAQLVEVVNRYVDDLGHRNADKTLFGYRCDRYATGLKTTNNKSVSTDECPAALALVSGPPIPSHSVPVIDVERGDVWAMFYRDHADYKTPFTVYAAELFKVVDGKIRSIDIIDIDNPYPTKPVFAE
jgi:hypothetical protein